MSDNNSSSPSGCQLPIVFLGASAMAYFSMPEIDDSVTRLVASSVVGLATSTGGGLGGLTGAFIGALPGAITENEDTMKVGAVIGMIGGLIGGCYIGYIQSKDFMEDYAAPKKAEEVSVQTLSTSELQDLTGNTPKATDGFEFNNFNIA